MTTDPALPVPPDRDRPMQVADQVVLRASPQAVYDVIADPTRIPAWSPENTGAVTPRDGVLEVGDRFMGANRRGRFRWWTESVVLTADPGRRFTFRVERWGSRTRTVRVPVATWDFLLDPVEDGVRLTETWTDDRDWPDLVATVFDKAATGTSFHAFQTRNIAKSLAALEAHVTDG